MAPVSSRVSSSASCNSLSRGLARDEVCARFADHAACVGSLFGVDLPAPCFCAVPPKIVKEFCGGLLDRRGPHLWDRCIDHLSRRDRVSISASLFSFRKVVPLRREDAPCPIEYARRMSVATPRDLSFERFCRKEIARMFRPGWDKGWFSAVLGASPSSSSCLDRTLREGGARAAAVGKRGWFLNACLNGENVNISQTRRVDTVLTDGKYRIVSAAPWESVVLKPLHSILYDKISKDGWLLRGTASPECFSDFRRLEGELFVSGDYESATDNLVLEHSEVILDAVLRQCRHVPWSVRDEAYRSLRCELRASDGVARMQARGQLMGNYLSFPLLCLANYLAFRYLVPRKRVPVRINGDDIVFRCTPSEKDRWFAGVSSLGLTVSVGKTLVSDRFFSLNSTYFDARPRRRPREVPIVRASFFSKGVYDASSIAGRVRAVGSGWDEVRASELRVRLLRKFARYIRCTGRSLTRGLGIPLTKSELARSGFYPWERFFTSYPKESPLPTRVSVSGALPPEWKRVPAPMGGSDDASFPISVARFCWRNATRRVDSDMYWSVVREGGNRYDPVKLNAKMAKRMGCANTSVLRKWWAEGFGRLVQPAVAKTKVWVRRPVNSSCGSSSALRSAGARGTLRTGLAFLPGGSAS